MGGELGNETINITNIDLLLGSSTSLQHTSPFHGERRFYYEFSVKKLVFSSLHRYLIEIESNCKLTRYTICRFSYQV